MRKTTFVDRSSQFPNIIRRNLSNSSHDGGLILLSSAVNLPLKDISDVLDCMGSDPAGEGACSKSKPWYMQWSIAMHENKVFTECQAFKLAVERSFVC